MKKTLQQLETELIYAEARAYDSDWMVRMQGRQDVERLKAAIKRKARFSGGCDHPQGDRHPSDSCRPEA